MLGILKRVTTSPNGVITTQMSSMALRVYYTKLGPPLGVCDKISYPNSCPKRFRIHSPDGSTIQLGILIWVCHSTWNFNLGLDSTWNHNSNGDEFGAFRVQSYAHPIDWRHIADCFDVVLRNAGANMRNLALGWYRYMQKIVTLIRSNGKYR